LTSAIRCALLEGGDTDLCTQIRHLNWERVIHSDTLNTSERNVLGCNGWADKLLAVS
jgi:hypothetical protein